MLDFVRTQDFLIENFFKLLVTNFPFLIPLFSKITFFGSFGFMFFASIFIICIFIIFSVLMSDDNFLYKNLPPFLVAILLSSVVTYYAKIYFGEVGPANRILYESDFSFPSGHAAMTTAFFGILYYLFRKSIRSKNKKYIFFIFTLATILLICISRLVLDVHYFSDVVAGVGVGIFGLVSGVIVYKK